MTGRTGVVLAGGHSRRFGSEDKALAELDGEPLIKRVGVRVSTAVEELIVSCRFSQIGPFQRALSSVPVDEIVEDRVADAGPLAGIETGFDAASGEYTAVVACDMPLVEPSVLETLFDRAHNADAIVPEHDDSQLQPVQAVYRTKAVDNAVARIFPEEGSLHALTDELDTVTVPAETLPERSFQNVNTRRDLATIEQRCDEFANELDR